MAAGSALDSDFPPGSELRAVQLPPRTVDRAPMPALVPGIFGPRRAVSGLFAQGVEAVSSESSSEWRCSSTESNFSG